jgi:CRISPR system Cascade subunit CasC
MSEFIQIHMLTAYPPANLNRDELNRPKTAMMGGTQRLRISSQCLKRTWRTSDAFKEALGEHLGKRTKEMGKAICEALTQGVPLQAAINDTADKVPTDQKRKTVAETEALDWAVLMAAAFGEQEAATQEKPKKNLEAKQLVHFSPNELRAIDELMATVADRGTGPTGVECEALRQEAYAVDIAMFGRMLAKFPSANKEAAVQVAHAISVNAVTVEDDYFTAVDDLNRGEEDRGSAHIGELGFGAGLFYEYVCINRTLLEENLSPSADVTPEAKTLAGKAIRALIEAAATAAPSGKQNSFGSRARASYILIEKGCQQPRSLVVAFLDPVEPRDMMKNSIARLRSERENMEHTYGKCAQMEREMCVPEKNGSLKEILDFAAGA